MVRGSPGTVEHAGDIEACAVTGLSRQGRVGGWPAGPFQTVADAGDTDWLMDKGGLVACAKEIL